MSAIDQTVSINFDRMVTGTKAPVNVNTRVVCVLAELRDYGVRVDVDEPWAGSDEARPEYAVDPVVQSEIGACGGVVRATAHDVLRAVSGLNWVFARVDGELRPS